VAWDMSGFSVVPEKSEETYLPLMKEYSADCSIRLDREKRRLAIIVSKYNHCLQEIPSNRNVEKPLNGSCEPDVANWK